jgi:hypothetical protein
MIAQATSTFCAHASSASPSPATAVAISPPAAPTSRHPPTALLAAGRRSSRFAFPFELGACPLQRQQDVIGLGSPNDCPMKGVESLGLAPDREHDAEVLGVHLRRTVENCVDQRETARPALPRAT